VTERDIIITAPNRMM